MKEDIFEVDYFFAACNFDSDEIDYKIHDAHDECDCLIGVGPALILEWESNVKCINVNLAKLK